MRVAIIGAGIGGLAAALALRTLEEPPEVTVFEEAPVLQPVGAGIWVPPNGMAVLDRLGVAREVQRRGLDVERAEVLDAASARPLQSLEFHTVRQRFGYGNVAIHRGQLHQALLDALGPGAVRLGRRCLAIESDGAGVRVRFAEPEPSFAADMVIGADGLHSAVRRSLFPEAALRYTGQTCYRGVAPMDLGEGIHPVAREIWGGAYRFGYSSIAPGQVYWFAPYVAPAGLEQDPEAAKAELESRYASFPPPVADLLASTPVSAFLRTDLFDLQPMKRWWEGRVLLIGDAAHATTPNLGQGGAQALEDALALATCWSPESPERTAAELERRRMPKARRIVGLSWRFGQMAHLGGLGRKVRNLVLRATPDRVTDRQLEWLYTLAV